MLVKYGPDVDILPVRPSDDVVDYAEQGGGVIAHFAHDGRSGLFEIQGPRKFLLGSITSLVKGEEVRVK